MSYDPNEAADNVADAADDYLNEVFDNDVPDDYRSDD